MLGVTRGDILLVFENYCASIQRFLRNGYQVNTELFKIYPSIAGIFLNKDGTFDRNRPQIKLSLNAGNRLKDIVNSIDVNFFFINEVTPVVQRVEDLKTHTVNSEFTPRNIVAIRGSNLKFEESDPEQGVFFIDESSKAIACR